jgi:hypothetical protein
MTGPAEAGCAVVEKLHFGQFLPGIFYKMHPYNQRPDFQQLRATA